MSQSTWQIAESKFNIADLKHYEGIFTLGNGYMHVRGSLEEGLASQPQDRVSNVLEPDVDCTEELLSKVGTFVPGLLGRSQTARRQIVNLPYFFHMGFSVGGDSLDMQQSQIENYSRHLDMQRAILCRKQTWRLPDGSKLHMCFERIVSAARKHLAIQRVTLRAETSLRLNIAGGIDGNVTTANCDLFKEFEIQQTEPNTLIGRIKTNLNETIQIAVEMKGLEIDWDFREEKRLGQLMGGVELQAGREMVLEKRIALTTSRDGVSVVPQAVLRDAEELSFDELLHEHTEVWAGRWKASDVVIFGDDDSQRALRHSLYHLHRALVRGDRRAAIGAKGYAGELYKGLYFWDTEIYMLPFYLYVSPDEAHSLCDYRNQALSGAKRVAEGYGYVGARFPWIADPAGDECCVPWLFKETQIHVSADVIYGLLHWAKAACDPAYLTGPCGETLLQVARYFLDRIDALPGDSLPHYVGVMGPDEFTPLRADNYFTNRMIRLVMEQAALLGGRIGATPEEVAQFRQVSETLPLPRRDDGLVLQSADFEQLAEIDINGLWKRREIPFEWQVSRERIHHSRVLKQADVLLLMTLFPQEFTDADVQAAWDFYEPITVHDSSLSAGVHAIIATRLNLMDSAWEYWKHSVELDLKKGHGGAKEGIHIACCGANWQIAVLGFAGMKTAMQADVFTLNPNLPEAWRSMSFPVIWKRQPLHVNIDHEYVTLIHNGDKTLDVMIGDKRYTLFPGETLVTPCHGKVNR